MRMQALRRNKYPVKSLIKALRILESVGESPAGSSISEVGRSLKIGKSTVHRILATLKDEGFVLVDPLTSRYTLGSKIAKLGEEVSTQSALVKLGVDVLKRLVEETHETAYLAILDAGEVLCIAQEESKQTLRVSGEVADRLPAYCSALGKVLLADKTDAEVRALYRGIRKFRKFTPNTIGTVDELLTELNAVRRDRIGNDNEELYANLICLSAGVRDFSGKVIAALGVSVPMYRMTLERRRFFTDAILRASSELSGKLGYVASQGPISGQSFVARR